MSPLARKEPLSFITGPGNEHDSKRFVEVLGMIRIGIGKGGPGSRHGEVDADSAYDDKNLRGYLKQRGIKANIPGNDRNRKNPKRGRPIRFNGESSRLEDQSKVLWMAQNGVQKDSHKLRTFEYLLYWHD